MSADGRSGRRSMKRPNSTPRTHTTALVLKRKFTEHLNAKNPNAKLPVPQLPVIKSKEPVSPGPKSLGRAALAVTPPQTPTSPKEDSDRTIFEITEGKLSPAISKSRPVKLKWKTSSPVNSTSREKDTKSKEPIPKSKESLRREKESPAEKTMKRKIKKKSSEAMPNVEGKKEEGQVVEKSEATERTTENDKANQPTEEDLKLQQTAKRLLDILKRNNFLENLLLPRQNEELKEFFAGGMDPDKLTKQVLELLEAAMDRMLDLIVFKGDDLDTPIDNDIRVFIINRVVAKIRILDSLLANPEYLPFAWGGKCVVVEMENGTSPSDGKSPPPTPSNVPASPWSNLMSKAVQAKSAEEIASTKEPKVLQPAYPVPAQPLSPASLPGGVVPPPGQIKPPANLPTRSAYFPV